MKKRFLVLLSVLLCALLLSACGDREPDGSDRETFPEETYVEVADAVLSYRGSLDRGDYPAETAVGAWLAGCSASDRDEQFEVYTLRHESAAGDKTTFTYLIYYPHGEDGLTATPELLQGEGEYVIQLTYTAGDSTEGYSLCYLSVTLPTSQAPRLRLLRDGDTLAQLVTISADTIG